MISGMIFEQRQIFKAPVRFSDNSQVKVRPIVVISNNKHNNSCEDLICCPITSSGEGSFGRVIYPQDYEVENKTLEVPQSEIKSQYPLVLNKSCLIPLKTGRVKIKKELAKKIVEDINEIIETK